MKAIREFFNTCKTCKFYNEEKANRMFITHYCDAYECQVDARLFCKYKIGLTDNKDKQ